MGLLVILSFILFVIQSYSKWLAERHYFSGKKLWLTECIVTSKLNIFGEYLQKLIGPWQFPNGVPYSMNCSTAISIYVEAEQVPLMTSRIVILEVITRGTPLVKYTYMALKSYLGKRRLNYEEG